MATPVKLNTSTSIVDFLKSQGKDSSFGARASLYKTSGLEERLGAYTGSANQNIAFLKSLQTPVAPTPTPTPETPPTAPQGPTQPTIEQPVGTSGITATQAIQSIPGLPSSDDILKQVLESSTFQTFKRSAEANKLTDIGSAAATKEKLERDAAGNTQNFIDQMGRRGLFFSGETNTGLASIATELAASKLGVDRELANTLLQSDLKTQSVILDQVEAIVKDAQNGRKEALAALEKVGLTVVGDQVVPTLAAQREERQIQAEERLQETAEFNRAAAEQRLILSEEAALRAEARLQLALDKGSGTGTITSGGLSIPKGSIGQAAKQLNSLRGPDGWTDPNVYESMYYEWVNQGGLPQDFKSSFPPKDYINPQNSTILPFLRNTSTDALPSLF